MKSRLIIGCSAFYPKLFQRGIVLYSGREIVPFGTDLFAVPLSVWWALNAPRPIEHTGFSRKIVGQRLLPRLGKISGGTRVAANSFSSRHQVTDLGGRQPGHPVELVREFL